MGTEPLLLSLYQVKKFLEAYDAKALDHITEVAACYCDSTHSHSIRQLKQRATAYDFEGALVVAQKIIDEIKHEQAE